VVKNGEGRSLIVELKGCNVSDAGPQIKNTRSFLSSNNHTDKSPSALIVCAKVPLGVSTVQRLAEDLRKAGIRKLKVKSRCWEGSLEDLF
jgi:hypothetical protein